MLKVDTQQGVRVWGRRIVRANVVFAFVLAHNACDQSTQAVPVVRAQRVATRFSCRDDVCTQVHPRLPDDGDWSCAAMAGAAICLGGAVPAGVARPFVDPAWRCGEISGRAAHERRVCIDEHPDFPDGKAAGWRCHYRHEGAPLRICVRDPNARALGDACAADRPCVDGAQCASGRCVAPTPTQYCWIDADCGAGSECRFAGCRRKDAHP